MMKGPTLLTSPEASGKIRIEALSAVSTAMGSVGKLVAASGLIIIENRERPMTRVKANKCSGARRGPILSHIFLCGPRPSCQSQR